VLGGRDAERLENVAAICRGKGAVVRITVIDVTDVVAMRRWVNDADTEQSLDLVIANAGVSGESRPPGDDLDVSHRIYAVNVMGMLNTIEPILPQFRSRRAGAICIVASVAGFFGVPRGPAYSGSKASMIIHGEAWSRALAPYGVNVTIACPGYIRTPMTSLRASKLPFIMEPDEAARIIIQSIKSGRTKIIFPLQMRIAAMVLSLLPEAVVSRFLPGPDRNDR
jgi:short-subunit dehydrogenase